MDRFYISFYISRVVKFTSFYISKPRTAMYTGLLVVMIMVIQIQILSPRRLEGVNYEVVSAFFIASLIFTSVFTSADKEGRYGMASTKEAYPYELARLVKGSRDWYIVWYIYSVKQEKLIRRTVNIPRKLKNEKKKEQWANDEISFINKILREGAVADEEDTEDVTEESVPQLLVPAVVIPVAVPEKVEIEVIKGFNIDKTTLIKAIDQALTIKQRTVAESTFANYSTLKNKLLIFLEKRGLSKLLLKDVAPGHVYAFLDAELDSGISAKTFNNLLTSLSSVFNVFVKRRLLQSNPCDEVDELNTETIKHVPYTNEQLIMIRDYLHDRDPQLLLYIQFLYYTLGRPGEVKKIKISDVDLKGERIRFLSEHAKNRKTQYVVIPDEFDSVLRNFDIQKYHLNHYIFSADRVPGPNTVGKNYFYKRHRKMLDELQFGENYTLYGYKHTAVTNLYNAGVELRFIAEQARHSSEYQTRIYLRQLGLYRNDSLKKNYPKFG